MANIQKIRTASGRTSIVSYKVSCEECDKIVGSFASSAPAERAANAHEAKHDRDAAASAGSGEPCGRCGAETECYAICAEAN